VAKPTVARDLSGFMLCTANGAPVMWTDTSTRAIACYAIAKHRIIIGDDGYRIEHERLKADGWKIRPASVTVTYED